MAPQTLVASSNPVRLDRNLAAVVAFYERVAAREAARLARVQMRIAVAAEAGAHVARTSTFEACVRAAVEAARAQGACGDEVEAAARAALGPTENARAAALEVAECRGLGAIYRAAYEAADRTARSHAAAVASPAVLDALRTLKATVVAVTAPSQRAASRAAAQLQATYARLRDRLRVVPQLRAVRISARIPHHRSRARRIRPVAVSAAGDGSAPAEPPASPCSRSRCFLGGEA